MNSAGQPEGHLETWRLEKRDKSGGPEIALGCARWFGFKITKPGSNQNRTTTCGSLGGRVGLCVLRLSCREAKPPCAWDNEEHDMEVVVELNK